MKINWTIVETRDGWCLRCTQMQKHQIHNVYKMTFIRFIDALSAAQMLQLELTKWHNKKRAI